MIKHWLHATLFCLITASASSQTLFTYGSHKASSEEFMKAFHKNNPPGNRSKAEAMKEYLELYINSKLKIQTAYDLGYDTLAQIKLETENLRNTIVDNYMSDPEAVTRLSKEAFQRSLKDIRAAHIFISFTSKDGLSDTAAAKAKLTGAEKRLAKGDDFLTVAQQLSDDPAAASNKGDLGFVTVFTLPYELETLLYSTPAGRHSKVYTSKAGYHIFKNISERKALGKIRVQQILLAFPPAASDAVDRKTAQLADSLYLRILKGDDFGKLAASFSDDHNSAARDGLTPEIGVGEYDQQFEKAVWALAKDGDVSKPFKTSHGYHIVKRLRLIPVITNAADKENNQQLEMRVRADDRWKTAKDFIYTRVKSKPGIQQSGIKESTIWAVTDSMIAGRQAQNINMDTEVFHIGTSIFRFSDWLQHVQSYRYMPGGATVRPYPSLMEEFKNNAMYQYYRDHLEDYNEDFRNQMAEFRDGNLFFEVMQREVWNKAQTDTAELEKLYEKNKAQYIWQPSADAIVFFSNDQGVAKSLAEELKKSPTAWKALAEKYNEKVVGDSARYEWTQLPGQTKETPKAGTVTSMTLNQADNTASFAYIIKVYPQQGIRSFNEAKGLVMNDYQTLLETEWIKKLRAKYPVSVNQPALNTLIK
ncbi:peptidylprolyl isomerase [Terrimonas sp. NA20]|uniref:peptidylprolyl isomerase n=1 Tax=Terrimonas ginsenosidimutans TaxID=2908004 RepID=A0ABS9KUV0_9BACT|nr:peptidylprolyl isomerase [Terrimonas ginsenosidimutans]MCG2616088.1 peptidylprolyl isomerase [Terrimonas ginsenosidimutans]